MLFPLGHPGPMETNGLRCCYFFARFADANVLTRKIMQQKVFENVRLWQKQSALMWIHMRLFCVLYGTIKNNVAGLNKASLWLQFREDLLFQHCPVHKANRALTSNAFSTFKMNSNCEPGFITQHQYMNSPMLLWLSGSKSLQQGNRISWNDFAAWRV